MLIEDQRLRSFAPLSVLPDIPPGWGDQQFQRLARSASFEIS
ncbi:hypothetical protein X769_28920 [Mesorhizobium sp. LSJC268A00]|nr:hypothetical protein X769_28920 [Mesorhizobium sp. LSJC268A00]ESZ11350.1 hypothetical protein X735_25200 [Mesorhizobium sp. L2C085B000]